MSSADTEAPDAAEAEEEAPRDEALEALADEIAGELGDGVVDRHIRVGDTLWLRLDREAWALAAEVLRRRLRFSFFDFLSAIDWLPSPFGRDMDSQEDLAVHGADEKEPAPMVTGYAGGDTRFQVFARVFSVARGQGVILKTDVPEDDLVVDTWTGTYGGADWHERETFEMYGISFRGHPDLRKLYLPAGFEGHPLRKDFPLLARRVKPWPGIVDVEQMPSDDEDEGGESEGGSE